MEMSIREDVPIWTIVKQRHVGPYRDIGQAFERLKLSISNAGVSVTGPMLAIYPDDPELTPEAELQSYACVVVDPELTTGSADVTVETLPGGRYAVATHIGSYADLAQSWNTLMNQWTPASGAIHDPSRPCLEVYIDDCSNTPIARLRTELLHPVH